MKTKLEQAQDPNTSSDFSESFPLEKDLEFIFYLEKSSKDENWGTRYYVALNPNTSSKTLEELSKDKEYLVRSNVAKNPNTSSKTLKILYRDENPWVKEAVLENPNFKLIFLS